MVPKEQYRIDSGSSVIHLLNRITKANVEMHEQETYQIGFTIQNLLCTQVFCVHCPIRFRRVCL